MTPKRTGRFAGWCRRSCRTAVLVLSIGIPAGNSVHAAPPDFARRILPILRRSCFECHGAQVKKGGLRLDEREAALKGGDSGAVIEVGKPTASEFIRRISLSKDDPEVMPARGPLLSTEEITLLRDWIAEGAGWPDSVAATPHWAYEKPVRSPPPSVANAAWPRHPIDSFLLARMEQAGVAPAPEADRPTLIRRLSLDLTGLPPTIAEVETFLTDERPDAYEQLVDRLLASPKFGERWARPWLDLARYADSHGFQRDDLREIWAYRDWVIGALNADMPFNQFTIEQLAGDLLPEASAAQRIATGFNRCVTLNVEAGSEPEETRVNQVIDRVNTTAAIWLGTTLECAQCHDHKYDPFTQRDYYRLLAFFNNTAIEAERTKPNAPGSIKFLAKGMPLHVPEIDAARARLLLEINALQKKLDARRRELADDTAGWEAALAEVIRTAPQTHPVGIDSFESAAGAPHRTLEDDSILLIDDPPERDTYTLRVTSQLPEIRGFKLEALTDPSLPGSGPGRGDASRPDFELCSFSVAIASKSGDGEHTPVGLRNARASYSEKDRDVAGAIDSDPRTAWGIGSKARESHWASFETERPVGSAEGTTFVFTLVQDAGGGKTIGRLRLSLLTGDPGGKAIPAAVVTACRVPAAERSPEQDRRLVDYQLELDDVGQHLLARIAELKQRRDAIKIPTTLVMEELPEPRSTHVLVRGDYQAHGDGVEPGVPAIFPQIAASPESRSDRLALARWLVSLENPLAARVVVNRWWGELFGRGIVSTVEDFGAKGDGPSHPELLDWLAVEFMENGWSMKGLLRAIVTTSAYRQASHVTAEALARDPENKLLSRGARLRLDAESIRDNALAIAGLLSAKTGGPPVRPFQPEGLWTKVGGDRIQYTISAGDDRYRRGIYVVWKRAALYPSFANFDATPRLVCLTRRVRTNTPLQALTLLNDPVYVEAAAALARRILVETPGATIDERIRHAFRLCLAREPAAMEQKTIAELIRQQQDAAARSSDGTAPAGETTSKASEALSAELPAWLAVATVLLNLDETITKE